MEDETYEMKHYVVEKEAKEVKQKHCHMNCVVKVYMYGRACVGWRYLGSPAICKLRQEKKCIHTEIFPLKIQRAG